MNENREKLDFSTESEQEDANVGALFTEDQQDPWSDYGSAGAERKKRLRGGLDLYSHLSHGADTYEQDFFQRKPLIRNTHWSIAWSDLMMTMFVLFMVMFVYKTADREFLSGEGLGHYTGDKIGREEVLSGPGGTNNFKVFGEKAFSRIYDFSKLTNLENELKEFAEIDLGSDKTLRIILTGDLLFPLGKAELVGDSLGYLRKIGIFLKDTPYKINVIGHTDNIPIKSSGTASNWELSAKRASAVVQYLIAETKLPARQFYVTGHAEYRPVVPNDSPENRAKNRRVEIVVSKEMPAAQPFGFADLEKDRS